LGPSLVMLPSETAGVARVGQNRRDRMVSAECPLVLPDHDPAPAAIRVGQLGDQGSCLRPTGPRGRQARPGQAYEVSERNVLAAVFCRPLPDKLESTRQPIGGDAS
jgi:hypothetical protein